MKKKVLIAEDEKPMAHALELKIKATVPDIDITVVSNGEDAVNKLLSENYDLALLDLVMPKKDGFTVLGEIHDKKKKLSAIILSNLAQPEDMKRAKELGALEYFIKSDTSIADIAKRVKKELGL